MNDYRAPSTMTRLLLSGETNAIMLARRAQGWWIRTMGVLCVVLIGSLPMGRPVVMSVAQSSSLGPSLTARTISRQSLPSGLAAAVHAALGPASRTSLDGLAGMHSGASDLSPLQLSQQQELTATDSMTRDDFGRSVALVLQR